MLLKTFLLSCGVKRLMNKQIIYVLLTIVLLMILWLGLFKLSYSNSRIRNKIAMLISSHTRVPVSYSFSLFATVFYSSMPLLGSLILSKAFGFSLLPLFTNYTGATALPVDILIGLLAVMSIDSVPLVMLAVINPKIRIDKEMQEVNWIAGISKIPGKLSVLIPCISACCEEVFFRGAVLSAITYAGMSFGNAAVITTIFFICNQVYLTKKPVQAFVLGASSLAISIVSCVLIGLTGNLIPSFVIHASFAGFYASYKIQTQ